MKRMKLKYTHWKAGEITRIVTPIRGGLSNHYTDGARIYQVGMAGGVFNAGSVLAGKVKLSTPIRIGWDGAVQSND